MDTVLSETGLQQAEAAGRYLGDITFNNVFVSNLKRAMQVRQKNHDIVFIHCHIMQICVCVCSAVGVLKE